MKVYRLDVFVLTIGWLSVVEYYVAEARHRHGHDDNNAEHKRRHRNNRHQDGWRPWGQWSACNAECGTGVAIRLRECSHNNGSQYEMCRGRKKQFQICNTQECVRGQKSLRARLCSAHDTDDMGNGKRYRWLPYLLHTNRCELTCRAAGRGFYNSFPERVTNGSLCNRKGSAVCIDGVCTKFGCDGIVGSRAIVDRCGVCDGDSTSCRIIREVYRERQPKYGYSKIGTIPAGATQINITQMRRSRNYLALKISNGIYIINGNRRLSPQGDHRGAGTVFSYHRTRSSKCGSECIFSKGPTNTDIDLMLLAYGVNGGIQYHYAYPESNVDRINTYQTTTQPTIYIDNKIDTGGVSSKLKNSTEVSYDDNNNNSTDSSSNNGVVTSYNAISTDESNSITIATTILQDASDNEVTTFNDLNNIVPTIRTGPYDVSGKTPAVPVNGNGRRMPKYTQSFKFMRKMRLKGRRKYNKFDRQNDKRYKNNRRYPPIIVEDHLQGPDNVLPDNHQVRAENGVVINVDRDEGVMITGDSDSGVRSYRYVITGYTPCSRTCGTGRKQPEIRCMSDDRYVDDNYCRSLSRPSSQPVECNNQPCPSVSIWDTGDWSSCSTSCGEGVQQRKINCMQEISPNVFIPADDCEQADEPVGTRNCNSGECSRWETGPWSQCSVTCGTGIKRRQVSCSGNPNSIGENTCDPSRKPRQEESCFVGSCSSSNTSIWYFNDWPSECPAECGAGKQQRQALCMRAQDMATDTGCSVFDKPQIERDCKARKRCGGSWFTGPWGKCNVTCGTGIQSRDVACIHRRRNGRFHAVAESNCPADDKPESQMTCSLEECSPNWFMSDWSECSSRCGPGQQTRDAKCLDSKHRLSTLCTDTKPTTTQPCESRQCNNVATTPAPTRTNSNCTDTYDYCDLVIRTSLCAYPYYRGLCCESCKNRR